MKILLTGSRGLLGSDCKEVLEKDYEIISPDKEEFDITNWDKVITVISQMSPDIILNCAAFSDVDGCETNRELSEKINVEGARSLAQGAARYDKAIVHISSDFVFDGKKRLPQPYFEDDFPKPLSFYGLTKAESEMAVKQNARNYIIIRTGWLYGIHGDHFLKKLLSLVLKDGKNSINVVEDQFGSPTWSFSLARQIKMLIDNKKEGIYHATSEGFCSRYEWAGYFFQKMGITVDILPCSAEYYPSAATRPLNSILENRQLKKEGLNIIPNWKADLDIFVDRYKEELLREMG